jgi:hypothetical protein
MGTRPALNLSLDFQVSTLVLSSVLVPSARRRKGHLPLGQGLQGCVHIHGKRLARISLSQFELQLHWCSSLSYHCRPLAAVASS